MEIFHGYVSLLEGSKGFTHMWDPFLSGSYGAGNRWVVAGDSPRMGESP